MEYPFDTKGINLYKQWEGEMHKATVCGITAFAVLFVFVATHNCYAGGNKHSRDFGNKKVADKSGLSFHKNGRHFTPANQDNKPKHHKGKPVDISPRRDPVDSGPVDPDKEQKYLREYPGKTVAISRGSERVDPVDSGPVDPDKEQKYLREYPGKTVAISRGSERVDPVDSGPVDPDKEQRYLGEYEGGIVAISRESDRVDPRDTGPVDPDKEQKYLREYPGTPVAISKP